MSLELGGWSVSRTSVSDLRVGPQTRILIMNGRCDQNAPASNQLPYIDVAKSNAQNEWKTNHTTIIQIYSLEISCVIIIVAGVGTLQKP